MRIYAVAAVCLAACGSAHVGGGAPVRGSESSGAVAAACGPATPPAILVERFEAYARQFGSTVHFNGIVASGFITHGTNVTTAIDVPAGACLSIVALASPNIHDLDAHLFGPNGDILVEDVESDPHPTVQLCATEARRVYHVIETFTTESSEAEGHGAYAIGTFSTDRHGLELVAHAIGGRPGTAIATSVDVPDVVRRLSELRDGIARRGFQPTGEVIRAEFSTHGTIRYPLPVTPDSCYTIAALSEGALTDTNLSILDRDDEEIARDVRPDRDAFVQICPASAQTLSMEVRSAPGPGWVLLQAFTADAAAVGGANTLWLGERVASLASGMALPQATESERVVLEPQGFRPAGNATTVTFAPGESREQHVTLEPGHCTAIAAVTGRGLGHTDVLVHAANGDFVARGKTNGPATVAILCPPTHEDLTVRLRAEVGSGDASLLTYSGPALPAWGNGVDRVAVSEALANQVATLAAGWSAEGLPERVRLGAHAIRTREFDVAAGTCSRVAVSSGQGLPGVALLLRNAAGQSVAQGSADGTAVLTHCVTSAEHVRLEMTIDPPTAAEYDAVLARYRRADRTGAGH